MEDYSAAVHRRGRSMIRNVLSFFFVSFVFDYCLVLYISIYTLSLFPTASFWIVHRETPDGNESAKYYENPQLLTECAHQHEKKEEKRFLGIDDFDHCLEKERNTNRTAFFVALLPATSQGRNSPRNRSCR